MNTIILENTEHGEVPVDVYQRLAGDRVLFLNDMIDDKLASDLSATLLLKDFEKVHPITLFINSEGGDIRSALMIYDTMNLLESPIQTVCTGSAMDEAALILAAGTKGMRTATKNSAIAIGQVDAHHVMFSNLVDADVSMKQLQRDNKKMMSILAERCGKKTQEIVEDLKIRKFLNSKEALNYGIIDRILKPSK